MYKIKYKNAIRQYMLTNTKQPESHDPDCLQIYKSNTTNKIIEALYIYYE